MNNDVNDVLAGGVGGHGENVSNGIISNIPPFLLSPVGSR